MIRILLLAISFTIPAAGERASIWHNTRPNCNDQQTGDRSQEVNTTERLTMLRIQMNEAHLFAYIIPMDDSHQSEYVSAHDKRVEFISGFSGSAGTAVVTMSESGLWTDGRYFLQAGNQLDCNWNLMREGVAGSVTIVEYFRFQLSSQSGQRTSGQSGQRTYIIGVDPSLISYDKWIDWSVRFEEFGAQLRAVDENLVDVAWRVKGGRPAQSNNPVTVLPLRYAGKSWQDKVLVVRREISPYAEAVVLSALDEVAWLFNLRGSDIDYCPVFFSYAIVSLTRVKLYMFNHTSVLDANLTSHLGVMPDGRCVSTEQCHVEVRDYRNFLTDLRHLTNETNKIWLSPMSSYALFAAVGNKTRLHIQPSIVRLLKSVKNPVEINAMKNSHNRDAAVLAEFIAMLEKEIKAGRTNWTEITAANRLDSMRRNATNSKGLSFATISGSGPNGAVIHYRSTPATDRNLSTTEMYLLDSGGQYLDGTTDVTRTFHFGQPTEMERDAYTRVLQGAINLALTVWPEGTYGKDIDSIARSPLWQAGLNYNHGTGHGIGMYLNVHEGPASISKPRNHDSPLQAGMFLSDEPGFYLAGKFGIRLETILMTKYISTKRRWLNDYNARVLNEIGEQILKPQGLAEAYDWLAARTLRIDDKNCYSSASGRHGDRVVTLAISVIVTAGTICFYKQLQITMK